MTILTVHAVNYYKTISYEKGTEQRMRFWYYQVLISLVSSFIEIYVDLFLLWLLFKFMKPPKILKDGRTEASALLFAHDAQRAQDNLVEHYKEVHARKQALELKKKHDNFINFVIKDMIAEMRTE